MSGGGGWTETETMDGIIRVFCFISPKAQFCVLYLIASVFFHFPLIRSNLVTNTCASTHPWYLICYQRCVSEHSIKPPIFLLTLAGSHWPISNLALLKSGQNFAVAVIYSSLWAVWQKCSGRLWRKSKMCCRGEANYLYGRRSVQSRLR